ncbi:MAG: altronate dehydratase family protein [Bacteroidota bacterium]|nr:altronate dehydratase family protein [Bacteroidota bacterium]
MINKVLKVHPNDDMIVALTDLEKGESINFEGNNYILQDVIPAKHKFATKDFNISESLKMYGVVVGKATQLIKKGGLIHTENLKHASEDYSIDKKKPYSWTAPENSKFKNRTFMGYHRSDGSIGTANYWLFIPTVFCENRNLEIIKEAFYQELGYAQPDKYKNFTKELATAFIQNEDIETVNFQSNIQHPKSKIFSNIDGIKFLTHQGGCGGTRQDSEILSKLLAAYADHPNVCGITIMNLGCEHLQAEALKKEIFDRNPNFDKPILSFSQQKGGTEETIVTDAIKQTFIELIKANNIERKPAPISKIKMGVKCGGSDGFSGISANPALGYAADLLVACGGTIMMAEFPELNGVEQEMVDRSINNDVANKFIHLMRSYSAQAEAVGSGFYMNPSPGNIKDGLITDAIKSCGAARKGGFSPVTDVLDYTEKSTKPGLNLVCTPGNDVEATTGKTASGANVICFTTGLGTPTGNPICPVIKIATNDALTQRMPDIIDINTGPIISGEKTIPQMGEEILEFVLKVASGEITPKAVQLGQDDFIPWKRGVSL